MDVEGIEPFLVRNGYRTVNYSQIDPNGLLRRPVLELDAIYRDIRKTFPQAPIHIVCHSRGGLLVRRWLATSRRLRSPSLTAIKSVQTLNSPHRGSALADLSRAIDTVGGFLAEGPDGLAAFMAHYRSTSVMMELATSDNIFLTQLESDERALAASGPLHQDVMFHAFAGTAPRLFRWHWYYPLADSYAPQWNWPPFQWRASYAGLQYDVPDLVAGILPDEARPGLGDVLVTVASSVPRTWTPAKTWHFPVNHSSVLWDGRVKGQLLTNLGGKQPVALSVGSVNVMVPPLLPNEAKGLNVSVVNRGVHAWGDNVTVRTVEPFPAAPWSARVTNLHAGGARTLTHTVVAPAATGTYEFGWALHHDQGGELDRSIRSVTVMTTCQALAQNIASQQEELDSLKGDSGREGSKTLRAQRIQAISRRIGELRAQQRKLRC